MRSHIVLLGVVTALLLLVANNHKRQKSASQGTVAIASEEITSSLVGLVPQASREDRTALSAEHATEELERSVADEGLNKTSGIITAQEVDTQINIRTSPSVDAEAIGYVLVGDAVFLSQSDTDSSGNIWHYITSPSSEMSGWIYGDFLKVQNSTFMQETSSFVEEDMHEESILKDALASNCTRPLNVDAYFLTQNHIIYLCYERDDLVYVSQEKGTAHVISADAVKVLQNSYAIVNETYKYYLDATNFRVVHVDDEGKETEILAEPIIHSEQY